MESQDKKIQDCTSNCADCPMMKESGEGHEGHCHQMPTQQFSGGLEGWKLALAAFWSFVMPLVLAGLGTFLAGESQSRKALGALIGLAVGIAIAAVSAKILLPKKTTATPNSENNENSINKDGEM